MLFWTRAFLCIGTVTGLAIQHLPETTPQSRSASSARSAATLAGVACRARPDLCAAAVTRGVGTLGPSMTDSWLQAALPLRKGIEAQGHRAVPWPRDALAMAVAGMATSQTRSARPHP